MAQKLRLITGCINHIPDDEEWRNTHLDVANRGIYDADLNAFVQPDFVADLSKELPMFPDAKFDEVRAWHVFEHLSNEQGTLAINAIFRVLKPGGVLDVEVPDMDRICQAWVDGAHSSLELQQWIYGEQLPVHEPGDSHRFGYNEALLVNKLWEAGFTVGDREETGLALRMIAVKPA